VMITSAKFCSRFYKCSKQQGWIYRNKECFLTKYNSQLEVLPSGGYSLQNIFPFKEHNSSMHDLQQMPLNLP